MNTSLDASTEWARLEFMAETCAMAAPRLFDCLQ